MKLNYQRLQPLDYPAAIEFSLKTRQLLFPELYNTQIPKDIICFEEYYVNSQLGCFIVVKDHHEHIIGCIAYRRYDERFELDVPQGAVEVVKLFVEPKYRRKGIASQLCKLLFQQAHHAGIRDFYLHTHPFLPAAEQFWQLQGFITIRRERLKTYETIHMLKSFSSNQMNAELQ